MSSLSSYLLATLLLARTTHIVPPSLTAATGRGTDTAATGLCLVCGSCGGGLVSHGARPTAVTATTCNKPTVVHIRRPTAMPDGRRWGKINASFSARRRVVSGANHACLRLIKRLSTHFRCVVAWTSWIFRVHGSVLQASSPTAAAS